jgi:hypothetical protein
MSGKLKAPERANREWREANDLLSKGFAQFAGTLRTPLAWHATAGSSHDRYH